VGGSRAYVEKIAKAIPEIRTNTSVLAVRRHRDGVEIVSRGGEVRRFDQIVLATHADQALEMLADPTAEEERLLGAFDYCANSAVLHSDATLMPQRRRVWSSWNYMSGDRGNSRRLAVSYWMNRLHKESILYTTDYTHPIFNARAMKAQSQLWSLQGQRNTWFCGGYFGAGFHEDGLQAGLAVAEALGGSRRPWIVANESGRIFISEPKVSNARATARLEVA
jgi:predicted NAD/FAD-binding protein